MENDWWSRKSTTRQQERACAFPYSLATWKCFLVCKWTQYDEIEFLLLLGYRPILFARDHNYFGSVGDFRRSPARRKIGTIVSANIVHTIVIIIVMIASHVTLASSRRRRTKRLFRPTENTLCNLISFLSHRQYTRTCKILSHLDRVITHRIYCTYDCTYYIHIYKCVYTLYIHIYIYMVMIAIRVAVSPARSK